jgi:myosin heavy subunit
MREEHDHTRGQLREAQQNLNRTQEQLTKMQQERDHARRQFMEEQQKRYHQLRMASQELTKMQQERNQAQGERDRLQRQLREVQIQLTKMQQERDQARKECDRPRAEEQGRAAEAQNSQEKFRVQSYQKAAGELLGITIPPMHPNLYQEACNAARHAAIKTGKFRENDQFEQMHKALFFKKGAYAVGCNSAEFRRLVEQHKNVFPYEIKRVHWQWKLINCLNIDHLNEQEYNRINQIEDINGLKSLIDEKTRENRLSPDKTQNIQKLNEEFNQIEKERRKIYGR